MQAVGMKSVGFGAESSSVTCQNQHQFPRVSSSPGPTQQDCAQNRGNTEQLPLTDSCCTAAYTAASTQVTTLGGNEPGPPSQTVPFLFLSAHLFSLLSFSQTNSCSKQSTRSPGNAPGAMEVSGPGAPPPSSPRPPEHSVRSQTCKRSVN